MGCEDALIHLLNYVWPNIFETSPHVINAVTEAIEGIRIACGPTVILQYLLQGLFHPARKVRTIYWKVYNNMYIGAQVHFHSSKNFYFITQTHKQTNITNVFRS